MRLRIISLLILLVQLIVTTPDLAFASHPEIKIGLIASQVGPAAEQGVSWLKGAKLAFSELKAQGAPIRLFVEDDRTESRSAVASFQKLANVDHVNAVIGGTWDFLAQPLIPLAQMANIPLVLPTNPIELYRQYVKGDNNLLISGLSLRAESVAVEGFLKKRGWKKLSIIVPDIPFGVSHRDMLRDLANRASLSIVSDLTFSYSATYFDELKIRIRRAVADKPDLIFCIADAAGVDLALRELRAVAPTLPILVTQHLEAAHAIATDRRNYVESFGIYPKVLDSKFSVSYKQHYNESPKVYAAEGYDALRYAYRVALARFDKGLETQLFPMSGATGLFRYPPLEGSVVDVEADIMTMKDGGLVSCRDCR